MNKIYSNFRNFILSKKILLRINKLHIDDIMETYIMLENLKYSEFCTLFINEHNI